MSVAFGAEGIPTETEARHAVLEALGDEDFEALSAFTDEFYAHSGDLISMLYDYTAKHRESIRGAPEAFRREKKSGGWLKRLLER
ncbi:MAG: hypothetical protein ACO1SV_19425 [Fimbriimonas sp.]